MKRLALVLVGLCSFGCKKHHASAARPAVTPRYVFIDGGANVGQTVLAFEKSTLFTKHPWTLVSFEPNPELTPKIPQKSWATIREEAIWTADTTLEFQFAPAEPLGGSVVDSIVKFPEMKNVKVKAIDFGRWLERTYRKEDVVYVKFDIEGSEYPVIEQMLKDGSIAWIDRFYIEFHGVQQAAAAGKQGWELLQVQKHDYELVQAITGLGIAVSLHETHEPQGSYFEFNPEKFGQKW